MTFRRPLLAQEMAEQLLRPSFLDESLRSGLFLAGQRRVGKTTFLANDLIPALEALNAIVIYVDLWKQPQANPADLVHDAIKTCFETLQTPGSALLERLKRVVGADIGAFGFKFGFKLDSLGTPSGTTLAQAFSELVAQARTDVVLIVDEVQHALGSPDGNNMLHALKAARDAVNLQPGTPGYFLFIGTGSHRARVQELSVKGNQAFNGAVSHEFPVLGRDFVEYQLQQAKSALKDRTPSLPVAFAAFSRMGSRPEELIKAFNVLRSLSLGTNPDEHLPTIAETLGAAAADVELQKIEALGALAEAVFTRICNKEGGVFSESTLAEYTLQLGREVTASEVQALSNSLLAANLIMRRGHGKYEVTDSLVEKAWRGRNDADDLSLPGSAPFAGQ